MKMGCGVNVECGCRRAASIFKIISFISVITLVAVFAWEYSTTIQPCILCVYERYPYGAALVLSIFALWRRNHCTTKLMMWLLTLVFLASLGLSGYHVAVEQHWLGSPAACMTNTTGVQSVYDVMQQVNAASTRLPCDQAGIMFLGLSLSVYNAIVSFLLFIGLVGWARRRNSCVSECCASNTKDTACKPRG